MILTIFNIKRLDNAPEMSYIVGISKKLNQEYRFYIGYKNSIQLTLKPETKEDIVEILNNFKCTENPFVTGADDIVVDSGFKITIQNTPNQGSNLLITYKSENYHINIETSIEFIKNFSVKSERKIYESEYHYFIGITMKNLSIMKINSMRFNSFNTINWYGGNITLKEVDEINKIINHLKN